MHNALNDANAGARKQSKRDDGTAADGPPDNGKTNQQSHKPLSNAGTSDMQASGSLNCKNTYKQQVTSSKRGMHLQSKHKRRLMTPQLAPMPTSDVANAATQRKELGRACISRKRMSIQRRGAKGIAMQQKQ